MPIHTSGRNIDYFLRIAYIGTRYGGWQRQANHSCTVQQTIEDLLSETLGARISITGCGRTDAGVHASQFYFYIRLHNELQDNELPKNFLQFMNKKLPVDISFLEVVNVPADAHVCIDATSRTYDYFFHDFSDPWLNQASSQLDLPEFQPEKFANSLSTLLGQNDFREFCLTPDRQNSTVVNMANVSLFQNTDRSRFRIRFVADRFVRGMIRVLVNDLISIGCGDWSPTQLVDLLAGSKRSVQVKLAPPEGLFLTGVSYPYIERIPDLPLSAQCEWEAVC